MGTDEFNAGGSSVMDEHPIRGGGGRNAIENGIISGLMSHLARIETLPYI